MGERNSVYVFKGPMKDEFREAIRSAVAELNGHLDWDTHPDPMVANLLTSHNECIHAAYIHQKGYEIATHIGSRLAIPWINVRIQEGSLWDYSLYDGESHIDNFSTYPEYWDDDKMWIQTQRGKPELLARVWQIEQTRIDKYLMPWRYESLVDGILLPSRRRSKAYPTDQYEHGDIWQMTDFLRALGAHDPNLDQPHCIPRQLDFATKKPWWFFWRR